MKKILIPALLLLASCGGEKNRTTETANAPADTASYNAASGATAQTSDSAVLSDAVSGATSVANQATFNGTLILPPQNHATVTLTMDGTVKSTPLLPGAYVKKGAVVATLENPEFISLQQSYLDARAQAEFLEKEYLRQQTLSQQEAASQKRFQQSKADYLSMKSRMDAAAAQLGLLGMSPQQLLSQGITPYMEVKAPIGGYVAGMQMNIGKHFAAGEPLCEIIDKSSPMLRLTAYEKDLDKFRVGDPVQFRVNGMGNTAFDAVLVSVGQQVDNMNRSLDIYARVKGNHERFRPGMYVTARIARK